MKSEFLKMSTVKLYLVLAQDDPVKSFIKNDEDVVKFAPCAWAKVTGSIGDPEIEALTTQELDTWSSAQKWLAQKRPELKRIICEEWKYCSRRAEYGDDYERLVEDIASQIKGVVGAHIAEIAATLLFKESLFSLCECGDIKKLVRDATAALQQERYDDHTYNLFAHITKLDPENHFAQWAQGLVRHRQHRYEEAIPHYKKAVALRPTEPSYLNNLGDVYANVKNDLETAQEYITLALKMAWNHPYGRSICLDSLGGLLCQRGKYAEALKYLPEALQTIRKEKDQYGYGVEVLQEVLFHIAVAYQGVGDTQKLQQAVEEIKQLGPHSYWAKKLKELNVA